jgi:hypothetical protein
MTVPPSPPFPPRPPWPPVLRKPPAATANSAKECERENAASKDADKRSYGGAHWRPHGRASIPAASRRMTSLYLSPGPRIARRRLTTVGASQMSRRAALWISVSFVTGTPTPKGDTLSDLLIRAKQAHQ